MLETGGGPNPCRILAEVGVNHNGDLETAKELVDVAADAGVDAVKFQTFDPQEVVTKGATKAAYQDRSVSDDQFDMLANLTLTDEEHKILFNHCRRNDVEYLSTPYDVDSVTQLESLGVKRYKIASADIINKPLLNAVIATGKPIILSTGMAELGEIERAIRLIRRTGDNDLTLLHCTSSYPADPGHVNMRFMDTLAMAFGEPVGFSDHTVGIHLPVMAVSRGAVAIEKHVTLDRTMEGPDHFASIEPDELSKMVDHVRDVEAAMGDTTLTITEDEHDNRQQLRRSLHARHDLAVGDIIAESDVKVVRPAEGITPWDIDSVVGRTVTDEVKAHAPIRWRDIAE